MFLIEIARGQYVDGRLISAVNISGEDLSYTTTYSSAIFSVHKDFEDRVLNQIDAMDDNFNNLQMARREVVRGDNA